MKHDFNFTALSTEIGHFVQIAYMFASYVQTCPEQVTAISCAFLAFNSFLRGWRRR